MDVTRTITYRGKPPWHTALVQFLKEEGVRVEWAPPDGEEQRGLGGDVNEVIVSLVSTGWPRRSQLRYGSSGTMGRDPRARSRSSPTTAASWTSRAAALGSCVGRRIAIHAQRS
jgi:hypothetical protein